MFTKPSLSDLIDGVLKTSENVLLPALDGHPASDAVTGLMMALDRVEAEWPTTARHLADDNLDIEHTLRRIEHLTATGATRELSTGISAAIPTESARELRLSTLELADHNQRLKSALVWTIDALDLPAGPDDAPAIRHADLEVRQLLARVLLREREANPPTPPRVSPLSRGGAAMDAAQVERMSSSLRDFLVSEMPDATDVRVTNFRALAGGASREAFVFDVSWTSPGGPASERCVMLRQPVSSVLESDDSEHLINGTRRLPQVEFKVVRAMEAQGIRVPHALWVEPTGKWLDRPFAVSRWIEGEADLSKLADAPNLQKLLDDYIDILARVHTVSLEAAGIDFLGTPTVDTAALEQIDLFDLGFAKQRLEDFPALAYIVRWLRKHQPVASRVSVVHGDFRLGNFMWDDAGIVAMLDWEQCHVGDPLEEIAFMYWPLWSLDPFIPLADFIVRYEKASGIPVDHDALAFYRVFIELKMSVVILTGIKSFFATPERQLMYGANTGYEFLRECQLRVIDELLNDGPTFEFNASAARTT